MARRRQIGQGRPRPLSAQQAAGGNCAKKTLRRVALLYALFVTLFTCPFPNSNPVCKIESFAHSTLVAPISNYLLQTETGARVSTAFNAHLAPFYQKHGAPIVGGVNSFVANTAVPVVKKAASPVCDAFHRAADPHIEKAASLYNAHAKPAVDAVENVVGGTARNYVIPVVVVVKDKCVKLVDEYAVPFFKSAVNEHMVPFFSNHVQPRWRTQVKPALGHYSKVAVDYTRSSVLPSIADGGAQGYRASRDFASAHVVPHAKRATVKTYVFFKTRVSPPIYSVYASTLKPHVDRVVPWEKVDFVTDKASVVFLAVLDVGKSFCEEFYYMLYTICTGEEHPAVIERLRQQSQMLIEDKDSAVTSSSELPLVTEHAGQIKNFARKVSGSARQWVQFARGWVGSAVEVAKDGMATYASRMSATAEEQLSMATEAANIATEAVIDKMAEVRSAASSATEAAAEFVAKETASASQTTASTITTFEPKVVVEQTKEAEKVIEQEEKHAEEEGEVEEDEVEEDEVEEVPQAEQKHEQEMKREIIEDAPSIASAASAAIAQKAEDIASNVAQPVTEAALDIESGAFDAFSAATEALADNVVPVAEKIAPIAEDAKETAENAFSTVTEAAAEAVHGPASAIVDHIPEPVEHAKDQAASVAELLTEEAKPAAVHSAAEVPNIVESLAQVVLEETTESLAVPTLEKPEAEAPAIDIAADKAASAIYEARDAMAGVVVQDQDRAMFEELVGSASDKVGNLEAFPSVVDDVDGASGPQTTDAQETQQAHPSTESSQTGAPPAVGRSERDSAIDSRPVVEKQEKPAAIIEKLVEKAESAVEAFAKPETTPEPEADKAADDSANVDADVNVDVDVDGDVRRSASNWVKDARMSISKEIAEERTRAVSQAADSSSEDANTAGSDVGDAAESEVRAEDVVPAVEVPAPIAAKDDEAKIEIVPPANNAVSIEEAAKLDKVVSAPIPVEKVPVPAKTVKESPVPVDDKPSVTENANPVVAPVKRAKKPADAAAASATGDSSTLTSAASAKGPRKIKKTKKRAVKKPAAATPVSVVDASAGTF